MNQFAHIIDEARKRLADDEPVTIVPREKKQPASPADEKLLDKEKRGVRMPYSHDPESLVDIWN